MNLKKLSKLFTRRTTSTDAKLTFWDELEPEESAMVQSLNSRSAGGFWKNFQTVTKEGFEKFMSKFYSGYGHKSIADCGSTSGAYDDVSMLAAKEIQNHWAYNGQETSTRYVDITKLGYEDPLKTAQSEQIMKNWFSFYIKALQPLIEHLKVVRPRKTDGENPEDEGKYNTNIEKRAYDILGSFLPAGAKTNVSCHMELRQWDDKLAYMIHHPLPEISELAKTTLDILIERYPNTFTKKKVYEESEKYRAEFESKFAYRKFGTNSANFDILTAIASTGFVFETKFQENTLIEDDYRELLEKRPIKTELPKIINEAGAYKLYSKIDFRSHRDLQRQRSALQRVPLLTTELGFERWYIDQLPTDLQAETIILLEKQCNLIDALDCDDFTRQYYIAMGYKVLDVFTVPLADLIYIIELRTPTSVHPTARRVALQSYNSLKEVLPSFVKIYADTSPDDLDMKRAEHDLFVGGTRFSEL